MGWRNVGQGDGMWTTDLESGQIADTGAVYLGETGTDTGHWAIFEKPGPMGWPVQAKGYLEDGYVQQVMDRQDSPTGW